MKKPFLSAIAVSLSLLVSDCGGRRESFDEDTLASAAEDLWGETIDLERHKTGLVLFHPFSPSNCGYCLFDEHFTDVNYRENTEERGGAFFGMCLFNPQLDVYGYLKHYRKETPVIAAPTAFHDYHRDGYPWLIAFRDGKRIHSGGVAPYETVFKEVRVEFWEEEVRLRPTSDLQLLTRFMWENNAGLALEVYPDDATLPPDQDSRSYAVVHESDLTEESLKMNLSFTGGSEDFGFEFLEDVEIPVEITSETVGIGGYNFSKAEVGLVAGFPNPFNPERCMILRLGGSGIETRTYQNWVDYVIYGNDPDGNVKILMSGLFDNDDQGWKYSEEKVWISEEALSMCVGACPAPPGMRPVKDKPGFKTPPSKHEMRDCGELWTLGRSGARFPSLAVDGHDVCWVVWEEDGDVILAELEEGGSSRVSAVENDVSDSFNPVVALDGLNPWVFYLNDRDGFYRLYGRYGDGSDLFGETVLSGEGAFDAVTPAAAFNDNGTIVAAWTEWRANQRYLMYRVIDGRMLGETRQVSIKKSDIDYTNAWTPSLAIDDSGKIRGAWNQHYPLTLGVYSGDLVEEAMPVTDDKGGYPSAVLDKEGVPWVFWESYMSDVRSDGKPQRIHAAYYDAGEGRWSLPYNLSADLPCAFNQTPKAAVDDEGVIWVAWSGRVDESGPWGVYLCHSEGDGWSPPELVSVQGEVSRAPAVSARGDGDVWIAWHSGTGPDMKVKVLRLRLTRGE